MASQHHRPLRNSKLDRESKSRYVMRDQDGPKGSTAQATLRNSDSIVSLAHDEERRDLTRQTS